MEPTTTSMTNEGSQVIIARRFPLPFSGINECVGCLVCGGTKHQIVHFVDEQSPECEVEDGYVSQPTQQSCHTSEVNKESPKNLERKRNGHLNKRRRLAGLVIFWFRE